MQDPEIQNILTDPVMRQVWYDLTDEGIKLILLWIAFYQYQHFIPEQVLVDFQENPKAAQEHMKNPLVMNKIQKLVSAGIVQVR